MSMVQTHLRLDFCQFSLPTIRAEWFTLSSLFVAGRNPRDKQIKTHFRDSPTLPPSLPLLHLFHRNCFVLCVWVMPWPFNPSIPYPSLNSNLLSLPLPSIQWLSVISQWVSHESLHSSFSSARVSVQVYNHHHPQQLNGHVAALLHTKKDRSLQRTDFDKRAHARCITKRERERGREGEREGYYHGSSLSSWIFKGETKDINARVSKGAMGRGWWWWLRPLLQAGGKILRRKLRRSLPPHHKSHTTH